MSPTRIAVLGTIALTLVLWAVMPMAQAADPPDGWAYNPANGHYYTLTDALPWASARAAAEALGGHLVTINDAEENAWLISGESPVDSTVSEHWIGLTDEAVEGT